MNIRKILYPTDFSEESHAALATAETFAKACNSTLVIVHVHEPELVYGIGMAEAYAQLPEELREHAEHILESVSPSDRMIPVERKLLLGGPPATRICDYAKNTEGIDMIIMSTHGRSGLSRLLMGSVAESVVRLAPCPVLTLRSTVASSLA